MRHLLIAAMLLAAASAGAAQNVFKCVEGNGKVTFQDHPCDGIGAAQCHSYVTPFTASSQTGSSKDQPSLLSMIEKEQAQKRAAAAAAAQLVAAKLAAAQAEADASASDDQDRRKLCDNNGHPVLVALKDPSATADCDQDVSRHTAQATAAVLVAAPGRR